MSTAELKIRPATSGDVDEVVRLAALMFASMGLDVDGPWLKEARDQFVDRLGRDATAFVVDHPIRVGRLVASGAGTISRRLPGPLNPSARVGYIQWIATDPEWRGRGLARDVMGELLDWYREREVPTVELHTTPAGERVYRPLGFDEGPNPALRITLGP